MPNITAKIICNANSRTSHGVHYPLGIISEDEPGGSMASGIRKNKVSVVCVYDENHVTSIKVENDIRVSAEIVKHPVNCFDCGFCRFGLLGSDSVEC